ncbi:NUDIX domain-containing protein [Ornithinimicrobium sp. Y1694]|uniref:NUDIX domain-containing protein n=1 Tax=Ornithinimicrobium sp. Y1694 TaxID=3418590 RepID=UPI003CEA173C
MDWDTRVGCYAWIEREGASGPEVLLTHWRSQQLADGRTVRGGWTLPGGGLELRETPEQAVVREVDEETGYAVSLTSILGTATIDLPPHDRAQPDGERFLQLVCLLWRAEVTGGALRVEEDGSSDDTRWVPVADLARMPCTAPIAVALPLLGRAPLAQPMLGWSPVDEKAVEQVKDLVAGRRDRHRSGALVVAIDGPSGSGKSVLGAAVARDLGAPLVQMDDLFPGWDGLAESSTLLAEQVLEPLRRGERAAYRRWDWHRDDWAEEVEVPSAEVLVVEGCGSSAGPAAAHVDVAVWVEADRAVRLERGLARDGESYRPHWERWASQETEVFGADGTRDRADLVVRTG